VPRIEDLYEVPPTEIVLLGGYHDGRRMRVPGNRDTWYMPVPVSIGLLDPEPDVSMPPEPERYRWTGSVKDDGTRVFRLV
jgi:hypothetical protein